MCGYCLMHPAFKNKQCMALQSARGVLVFYDSSDRSGSSGSSGSAGGADVLTDAIAGAGLKCPQDGILVEEHGRKYHALHPTCSGSRGRPTVPAREASPGLRAAISMAERAEARGTPVMFQDVAGLAIDTISESRVRFPAHLWFAGLDFVLGVGSFGSTAEVRDSCCLLPGI